MTVEECGGEREEQVEEPSGESFEEVVREETVAGNDVREFDALYDSVTPVDNDGRSKTETTFYPQDAPRGEREKWERLFVRQDGVGESDRAQRNREVNRVRDVLTWCSRLGYSEGMCDRVQYLVENVRPSEVSRGSRVESVLLAMVWLVGNEYGRQVRQEDVFDELRDDLGVSEVELRRRRRDVRDHDKYKL